VNAERLRIFYGAGHEQFTPRDLLRHARLAEEAGFDGVACSDHFQPWWPDGQSGHAWPWLGAVGASTERVVFGPAVTPAVARYHPALVAQAFATLEQMFPGRTFLAVGSGESLNESPLGFDWPDGETQLELMEEALLVIRRLWDGTTLHGGKHFPMKAAKLYTRPDTPPPLYVSAFHPGAAAVAGRIGDGLWCLGDPELAPGVIDAYRAACDDADRAPGEIVLQAMAAWGRDDDEALEGARPWKGAQPPEFYVDDWHDPAAMLAHGEETVSDDEFRQKAILSSDPNEHVERLREVVELGATTLAVMNLSGTDPEGAIRVYGEQVLPRLRESLAGARSAPQRVETKSW
jgi:coenzyme F420-dependent glucose-6-phosphate dehydrogenase